MPDDFINFRCQKFGDSAHAEGVAQHTRINHSSQGWYGVKSFFINLTVTNSVLHCAPLAQLGPPNEVMEASAHLEHTMLVIVAFLSVGG